MKTNLQQKKQSKIPAGIIEGIEAFWYNEEKWIIMDGRVMRFDDSPTHVRQMFTNAFRNDAESLRYLSKNAGKLTVSEAFDFWYRCKLGALDEAPDFVDGNLHADYFNHACKDYDCPHRGKFCSLGPGLKDYEVKTLAALKNGETIEKTADALCISLPGLKSRIEKLKEKLNAKNMAALIARACELRI